MTKTIKIVLVMHTWYKSDLSYFLKYEMSSFDKLLAESLLPSSFIFAGFILYLVCRDPTWYPKYNIDVAGK